MLHESCTGDISLNTWQYSVLLNCNIENNHLAKIALFAGLESIGSVIDFLQTFFNCDFCVSCVALRNPHKTGTILAEISGSDTPSTISTPLKVSNLPSW